MRKNKPGPQWLLRGPGGFKVSPMNNGKVKSKKQGKRSFKASPIRARKRRSRAEIQAIRDVLKEITSLYNPMTVRQCFYQLVFRGAIDKSELEYKNTVCRLLVEMRRSGEIPPHFIADNTRWMRKPETFHSLSQMLDETRKFYRRALWDSQKVYVECWLEKEALSGVLWDVTSEWDVPLMVTRGYPSYSFLFEASLALKGAGKPCHLFYLGDHDPSGLDIDRFVEQQLRELAPEVELHFERIAVTPDQIEEMGLPTRPTKKTDSRSKSFEGDSVEVDSIDPEELRELCREKILSYIDKAAMERLRIVEKAEKSTLMEMIENMG